MKKLLKKLVPILFVYFCFINSADAQPSICDSAICGPCMRVDFLGGGVSCANATWFWRYCGNPTTCGDIPTWGVDNADHLRVFGPCAQCPGQDCHCPCGIYLLEAGSTAAILDLNFYSITAPPPPPATPPYYPFTITYSVTPNAGCVGAFSFVDVRVINANWIQITVR